MLYLTRNPKPGKDTIVIRQYNHDDIKIVVRSVAGKQVSIGVDAPKEVKILREEVEDDGRE